MKTVLRAFVIVAIIVEVVLIGVSWTSDPNPDFWSPLLFGSAIIAQLLLLSYINGNWDSWDPTKKAIVAVGAVALPIVVPLAVGLIVMGAIVAFVLWAIRGDWFGRN
ncbi:MAG: hypothetical protein ACRD0K_02420 [Egibacteraceae bacterium]